MQAYLPTGAGIRGGPWLQWPLTRIVVRAQNERMTVPAFPPGVRPLDHTADVGLDVEADTLEELFRRAALGTAALIMGTESETAGVAPHSDSTTHRDLTLETDDEALLLVAWLRELVFLQAVHGLLFSDARFAVLEPTHLEARLALFVAPGPVVREIKGVTYHGLHVDRSDGGWKARVIFDV
jgi:SHS2 domain-containing protein